MQVFIFYDYGESEAVNCFIHMAISIWSFQNPFLHHVGENLFTFFFFYIFFCCCRHFSFLAFYFKTFLHNYYYYSHAILLRSFFLFFFPSFIQTKNNLLLNILFAIFVARRHSTHFYIVLDHMCELLYLFH